MRRRAAVAAAVALLAASPLSAQALLGSAGLSLGWVRSSSALGSTTSQLRGTVLGGEGRVRVGRVAFDVAYREGSIVSYDGNETRDYAEGRLLLLLATVPGVTLVAGPHARAYITSSGTQRWLFWTVRVRGEHELVGPSVSGYVEVWRSVGATVNVSEQFEKATGGEVGMNFRFGQSLFWGRAGYAIERAWLGSRSETVEGITAVVGFGRR
jgi:hypothetical protein